jgi:hypothetical protein
MRVPTKGGRQMRRAMAVVMGSMLFVAGCAGSMMGDKEMMKEDDGMMKKEGTMMKDDKGSMDKK